MTEPIPTHTSETPTGTIPLVKEEIVIGQRELVTGTVSIDKHVEIEAVEVDLESIEHGYDVERRALDGELLESPPAAVRKFGNSTIYTAVREVEVVVKRYQVVEELVVTPRHTTESRPTVVHRRVEKLDVKRTTP